jgi:hypothetical protein
VPDTPETDQPATDQPRRGREDAPYEGADEAGGARHVEPDEETAGWKAASEASKHDTGDSDS